MGIHAEIKDLFGIVPEAQIPGLKYIPGYISEETEKELMTQIDNSPWLNDLKRRVQHYGFKYDYKARNITSQLALGQMPNWAVAQTKQLCEAGLFPEEPDQVIVNEYQPGQGISPHIDCIPCFDDTIASLSLGSACMMEFINPQTKQKIPMLLEPRSLLVLSGDARYKWQHSIPARKTDKFNGLTYTRHRRLSLTFRNVLITA